MDEMQKEMLMRMLRGHGSEQGMFDPMMQQGPYIADEHGSDDLLMAGRFGGAARMAPRRVPRAAPAPRPAPTPPMRDIPDDNSGLGPGTGRAILDTTDQVLNSGPGRILGLPRWLMRGARSSASRQSANPRAQARYPREGH